MTDKLPDAGIDHRPDEHHPEICKELATLMSEYIDEELPTQLRLRVEEHLRVCFNCRRFVESIRRTRELAHLLGSPEIPRKRLEEISRAVKDRLPE